MFFICKNSVFMGIFCFLLISIYFLNNNLFACYFIFFDTSDAKNLPMMVGTLYGAVTNTPGLGAANEALSSVFKGEVPQIASGYACAYPLGVLGIIGATIAIRYITRTKLADEEKKLEEERKAAEEAARIAAEKAAAEAAAQADKELLAALIFCEAGNQPYEGQVAVGAVVMNRVESASYPNTISEVIYQSGQFTPAMTGWLDSVRANAGYTASAMRAAEDALAGSSPVGDCLYFSTGGWGMQIGDHYFH